MNKVERPNIELTASVFEEIKSAVIAEIKSYTNYEILPAKDRAGSDKMIDEAILLFADLIGVDQPEKIIMAVGELIHSGLSLKTLYPNR
jgi:hypothetical protein